MSANAIINLPLSDYAAMQAKIAKLEAEVHAAHAETEKARLGAEDSDARQLLTAFLTAMDIVGFSLANFDPLTVRGFPYGTLRTLSTLLPDLPGIPSGLRETATDLRLTSEGFESWEKTRAEGREQERLAEENAARSMGATHAAMARAAGGDVD